MVHRETPSRLGTPHAGWDAAPYRSLGQGQPSATCGAMSRDVPLREASASHDAQLTPRC
jgi:hypothetical protein